MTLKVFLTTVEGVDCLYVFIMSRTRFRVNKLASLAKLLSVCLRIKWL